MAEPECPITELGPGRPAEARTIRALLNRELGENLYSVESLLAAAADATAAVFSTTCDGRLAAAAVARILVPDDIAYYRPFGSLADELFNGHSVGSLEALAVRSEDRGRGLGAALVRHRIGWLAGQGCDRVVAISWLSGRGAASAPLFLRLGFSPGVVVSGFYLEESRRDGWSCPVCGNPCRCSAQLFWIAPEAMVHAALAAGARGRSARMPEMPPSSPSSPEADPEKRSDQAPGEEVVQVNDPYRGGGPPPEEQHGKEDEQHPTGG